MERGNGLKAKGQGWLMNRMLALEAREATGSGTTNVRLVVRRDEVGKVGRTSFFFQWKDLRCLVELRVLKDLLGDTLGSMFFKKNFYWRIVDLQCCLSFRCTAK